jgi:hypothetical protein
MTGLIVTHNFVSNVAPMANSSLVGSDQWNDTHIITGNIEYSNVANGPDSTITAAYSKANVALDTAVSAYNAANAVSGGVDITSIYNHSNAAFDAANTSQVTAVAAFAAANAASGGDISPAFNQANAAYDQANTGTTLAGNANANAAAAYDQATTSQSTAVAAYGQANTAYIHANNAYNRANTGVTDATTAQATAVASFGQANTAQTTGVAAFGQANTGVTLAGNANANAAAAFGAANTAQITAVAAFAAANSAGGGDISPAFNQANAAYDQANTSQITAVAAFAAANSAGGGGSVYSILKSKGNLSSVSFSNVENPLVWAAATISSSDVTVSGNEITIVNSGTYKFTVTLRTDSSNRTELFINTYFDTGGGWVQDTDAIVSDYVSRDNDQDTGAVTLIDIFELTAGDKVQFRGRGDCDGSCIGLNAGTILIIERVI